MEIVIPQTTGHVGLRIFAPEVDLKGAVDYFMVEIRDPSLCAKTRVYAYRGADALLDLFEAMARDWKGWDDQRSWESLEGEFALSCRSDSLGHVLIEVSLRPPLYPEVWHVRATALVEAGQLDALAANARSLFKQL